MAISGRVDDGVLIVTGVGEVVDVGKLAAGSRVVDDGGVAVEALVTVRPRQYQNPKPNTSTLSAASKQQQIVPPMGVQDEYA